MASIRRYEHKLATQRRADEAAADLSRYLQRDKMLKENFSSDDRVVTQRILKEQRVAAKEQYVAQSLHAAAASQERERMLREQDERLAAEISRRKTEKIREDKNVQRICEQSEELRELEEKLKAAYMNKEREAQIKESAALIQQQAYAESKMAEAMEADRQRGLQAEAYREYLREQDGILMRRSLDSQMAEKELRKAQAYEAFLKEKEAVDKVVEAILAEDEAERRARHAKEKEAKEYIDAFIREQEEYKEKRMAEIAAENAEIKRYADKVMAREQALRLEREKDQNARDKILEQITGEMAKKQKEADELEQLRNELVIQETEERILQKEKEKMQRAVQQRLDIALANEYQRQLKAIKREEEKEEEEEFRRAMFEKFAEDDRVDQMNAQKRRMKQLEHRREIERLLEERRAKYEEERQAELQEQLDAERVEQLRQQIIEDERKRMLAAHAKNLGLEHLPKGVLSTHDDLELFRREYVPNDDLPNAKRGGV